MHACMYADAHVRTYADAHAHRTQMRTPIERCVYGRAQRFGGRLYWTAPQALARLALAQVRENFLLLLPRDTIQLEKSVPCFA
eukprot:1572862-Pleurochrysis_carterae.AAC.3